MRHEITLQQTSPETLKVMPDTVRTMQLCLGVNARRWPRWWHRVWPKKDGASVFASRPGGPRSTRIFDMVHTNMANRLAHRHALEQKNAMEHQSAA